MGTTAQQLMECWGHDGIKMLEGLTDNLIPYKYVFLWRIPYRLLGGAR